MTKGQITFLIVWLAYGLAGALAFWRSLGLAGARVGDTAFPAVWTQIATITFAAAVASVWSSEGSRRTKAYAACAISGLFLATVAAFALWGTPYALMGINGDQGMRTALVTKTAAFGWSTDIYNAHLPPYYPPLYFYLLGKLANVLHAEPYRMLKVGLIATCAIMPLLTCWLWRPLAGSRKALLASLIFLVVQYWYKPDEWLSAIVFVAWHLRYVSGTGLKQKITKRQLLGVAIGAATFLTFYYWFFIGILSLGTRYCLSRALPEKQWPANVAGRVAWLGAVAVATSFYWAPYLLSIARTGGVPLQNRYYPPESIPMPLPFLEFSAAGLVYLIGFLYLLKRMRKNRLAFEMLNLLAACYAWIALGLLLDLAGAPTLHFKTDELMRVLLAAAGALAIAPMWRWANSRLRPTQWRRVSAVAGFAAFFYLAQNCAQGLANHPFVGEARKTIYASGFIGEVTSALGDGWEGKIILSDHLQIFSYLPAYSFVPWKGHFSHPAARFGARVDFLRQAAALKDAEAFHKALRENAFDSIDYLLLRKSGADYIFRYDFDLYPFGEEWRTVAFPGALFDERFFRKQTLGEYDLFVVLP